MSAVQKKLYELLAPTIEGLGYEAVGVEYIPQGKHSLLRLYIDQEAGVALEDCEKVSRQVSLFLDVEDPIRNEYSLEVSSPGLDRPLFLKEHFERFSGREITLRLSAPLEGRRKFKGMLKGVVNEQIVLEVDGQSQDQEAVLISLAQIEKANLIPEMG